MLAVSYLNLSIQLYVFKQNLKITIHWTGTLLFNPICSYRSQQHIICPGEVPPTSSNLSSSWGEFLQLKVFCCHAVISYSCSCGGELNPACADLAEYFLSHIKSLLCSGDLYLKVGSNCCCYGSLSCRTNVSKNIHYLTVKKTFMMAPRFLIFRVKWKKCDYTVYQVKCKTLKPHYEWTESDCQLLYKFLL